MKQHQIYIFSKYHSVSFAECFTFDYQNIYGVKKISYDTVCFQIVKFVKYPWAESMLFVAMMNLSGKG